MKRLVVLAACLAVCAGIASAQKVKFEFRPVKGLALTTKTTLSITLESDNAEMQQQLAMMSGGIDIEMSTEEKVKEVAETGDVTISSITKFTAMKMGGMDLMSMIAGRADQLTKGISMEMTRDKTGKVLNQSTSTDGGGMSSGPMAGFSRMAGPRVEPLQGFPATELGVGDAWEVEVPVNPAKPADKARIVVSVLGFETKDGVNLAKVKSMVDGAIKDPETLKQMGGGPMGGGGSAEEVTLKGDMTIFVRTEDGTSSQTEGTLVMKIKSKDSSLTINAKLKSVTTR